MTHELALDSVEPTTPPMEVAGTAQPSRPELRIASGRTAVDLEAAQRAAADFLAALGIDLDREGLRETEFFALVGVPG